MFLNQPKIKHFEEVSFFGSPLLPNKWNGFSLKNEFIFRGNNMRFQLNKQINTLGKKVFGIKDLKETHFKNVKNKK